jgi:uncharacterized cupredoxin-like copper-binding protein
MRARVLLMGTGLLLALALVAACGSSSKKSSTTPTTASGGGGGVTVPGSSTGTTVNVTVSDTKALNGPMTLKVTPASAPAGSVTFTVKNDGTIDHEVVVLKTNVAFDKLPVTGFEGEPNRVSESASVGETGDPALKPGETRSFTVKNMAAGSYVLVCNLAKHYGLGMRAPFTVK